MQTEFDVAISQFRSAPLVPEYGTCYQLLMRIIAQSTIASFSRKHPETKVALKHWLEVTLMANWASTYEVQRSFPKAKVLNGERVRFEISGGNYRLIVAFKFRSRLCFVKFLGTHAEYDRINALTISQF
jgi:mRNA interferase HigB